MRLSLLLLAICALAPSHAQEPLIVEGGVARTKIAVPPAWHRGEDVDVAAELVDTLRDDLVFTGRFELIEPRLYDSVRQERADDMQYEAWSSILAENVVTLEVTIRGGRIDLAAYLYAPETKTLLLGRRYGGSTEIVRRVAHQLADDILKTVWGIEGIARTRIAFTSLNGTSKEIYLMDYDGRRIRRITSTDTINITPAWSPDGSELAFMSWRDRQPGVQVMSVDGELGFLKTVGGELSLAPEWSPDGQKMAYSSDADGNQEIYVLDRRSGRNTRLTRNPAIDTAPAYSPTGRQIAFTSDRSGNPQIYLMDAEGLNQRRFSWSGPYNESAAWSPDGEKIAYVSRIDGRFEIVVQEVTGDKVTRLTFNEGNNENPRWSPDSRHLVFSSDRAGTYDIYSMPADGGQARRLTRNGNCFTPDWSRTP